MKYHQEKKSANYRVTEGEEREKEAESLFKEIMAENFEIWGEICSPKFMKLTGPQTNSTEKDLLQDTLY